MRHRISSTLGLLLLLVLISSPTLAAQGRKKAEPPPPPPQFRVDVATRTMAISRVVLSVPVGTVIGTLRNDALCIGRPFTLHSEHAFQGVPLTDYSAAFSAEAAAAGYRVAAAQSGDLFTTESAPQAEILVGAAILSLTADGCRRDILGVIDMSMDATMAVDWQVFDPLEKKILFRATNQGHAKARSSLTSGTITVEAARAAFRAAAKSILADPNFLAVLKDPRGGPPATGAPSLFPEAAASPPAPTKLPRIALHTKSFREQVTDLRQQVVTVLTAGGSGSGFYVADGLLLTNEHVVQGQSHLRIRFFGGREIPGEVLATNARRDVALVKTESVGLAGLSLRLDNPDLSSQVFVIGSPLGQEHEGSVIGGIVSAFRTNEHGPFIQSDVAVTHGNSGGPMFDDKGNVIAITDIGLSDGGGNPTAINLFIPIGDALKTLSIELGPEVNALRQ